MQKQLNIYLICWALNRDWSLADCIMIKAMVDIVGIL